MDLILITQVVIGEEEADLDERTGYETLGLGTEQQRSRPLQVLPLLKLQVGQQGSVTFLEHRFVDPATSGRPGPEVAQGVGLTIVQNQAG